MKLPREAWFKKAMAVAWRQGYDNAEKKAAAKLCEMQQELDRLNKEVLNSHQAFQAKPCSGDKVQISNKPEQHSCSIDSTDFEPEALAAIHISEKRSPGGTEADMCSLYFKCVCYSNTL